MFLRTGFAKGLHTCIPSLRELQGLRLSNYGVLECRTPPDAAKLVTISGMQSRQKAVCGVCVFSAVMQATMQCGCCADAAKRAGQCGSGGPEQNRVKPDGAPATVQALRWWCWRTAWWCRPFHLSVPSLCWAGELPHHVPLLTSFPAGPVRAEDVVCFELLSAQIGKSRT